MEAQYPKSKIAVANISAKEGSPIGIMENRTDNKKVFYSIPTYDMSRVTIENHFSLTSQEEEIYRVILQTDMGRQELNKLKNNKTNNIVNSYLEKVKTYDECLRLESKKTMLHNACDMIIGEPIEGQNLISQKAIGLTKKDIWLHFVSVGLVDKFRNAYK